MKRIASNNGGGFGILQSLQSVKSFGPSLQNQPPTKGVHRQLSMYSNYADVAANTSPHNRFGAHLRGGRNMLARGDFGGHSGISDTSNGERARGNFRTTLDPSLGLRTFHVMIIICTYTSFPMPII